MCANKWAQSRLKIMLQTNNSLTNYIYIVVCLCVSAYIYIYIYIYISTFVFVCLRMNRIWHLIRVYITQDTTRVDMTYDSTQSKSKKKKKYDCLKMFWVRFLILWHINLPGLFHANSILYRRRVMLLFHQKFEGIEGFLPFLRIIIRDWT